MGEVTAEQVRETAAKHFAGQDDLLLVAVDPQHLYVHDVAHLQKMLGSGSASGGGDAVDMAMAAMFERDGLPLPPKETDGSLILRANWSLVT